MGSGYNEGGRRRVQSCRDLMDTFCVRCEWLYRLYNILYMSLFFGFVENAMIAMTF